MKRFARQNSVIARRGSANQKIKAKAALFAAVAVSGVLSPTSRADISWDPTASSGASLGGTGTWNTTTPALWWNGSADVTWSALQGNSIFTGTAGTVTVGGTISGGSTAAIFETTGYTVTTNTSSRTFHINLDIGDPNNPGNATNLNILNPGDTMYFYSMNTTTGVTAPTTVTFTGSLSGYAKYGLDNAGVSWNVPIIINTAGAGPVDIAGTDGGSSTQSINTTITNNSSTTGLAIGATAADTLTLNGAISITASNTLGLTFETNNVGGTGTVVVATPQTYTGPTTVNNGYIATALGLVQIGVTNALPTTTDLTIGATGNTACGALDLDGNSQSVNSLSSVGTSAGILNSSTSPSTLTITGGKTTTYASTLGTPAITSSGIPANTTNFGLTLAASHTGQLTLTGNNSYTGGTIVNGGTLLVNNTSGSGTGSGTVSVGGGTLGGTGTISGAVSVNSGDLAPAGVGAVGTLTLGSTLNLAAGSHSEFDFSGVGSDQVVVGGTLTIPTSGVALVDIFNLGGLGNGTYPLFSTGGVSGGVVNTNLDLGSTPGIGTFGLTLNGNIVDLNVGGVANNLIWNGEVGVTSNGTWDTGTTATWLNGVTGSTFHTGDLVTFSDAAGGTTSVTITSAGVAPGAVTFSNMTKSYTLTGGPITGGTSLVLNGSNSSGAGTVTLDNGANTYSGGTTLNTGTLNVGPSTALGGNTVTIDSATLNVDPAAAVNVSSIIVNTGGTLVAGSGTSLGSSPINLVGGTLEPSASTTFSQAVSISPGTVNTNNFNTTITSALTGGGLLTVDGGGSLTLSAAGATGFSGGTTITNATVQVTSVDSNGVSGVGTGTVTVNSGGTFLINNAFVGFEPDGHTVGTGLIVNLNDGGTLEGMGHAELTGSGGFGVAESGTITFNVPGATDSFITGNSIRNLGTGGQSSSAVIDVTGNGDWHLASGGTSQSATGTQYSGTWEVNMGATGIFQLGPVLPTGFGEALNSGGYQAAEGGSATYSGANNAITINSGTIAFGADSPDYAGTTQPLAISYRDPLTFNGGNFASTGFEYSTATNTTSGAEFSTNPVAANLGSDVNFSDGATVTALVYDPMLPAGSGGRSINIMTDPNAISPVTGDPVSANISWGSGSTLIVQARAGDAGGALNIARDLNTTVTVATPASLEINSGATLNVGKVAAAPQYTTSGGVVTGYTAGGTITLVSGSIDPFTDSTDYGPGNIDTSESVSATVNGGTLDYGAVSTGGIMLYRLNTLSVQNSGNVIVDSATPHSQRSVLVVGGLAVDSTSKIDLTNNDMVIHQGSVSQVQALIAQGYAGGHWTGDGITSSSAAAVSNTALGYELNDDGGGGTLISTFDGGTVINTDVLVKYTYFGDANLDGVVNGDDYTLIDNGFNNTLAGWHNGDFNYDGVVNGDDYTLIDNAFNTQGASLAAAPAEMVASNTAQVAGGSAAVPEPATLGLLALGGMGLIGRRRRR